MTATRDDKLRATFMRDLRARHPRLREAIPADARVAAMNRGERSEFTSRGDLVIQILRLAFVSDAFLAQMFYRLKARLQALGVPVLPRIAHRAAIVIAQVAVGDPVVIDPGVYIVHGQVVIDGLVEIASDVIISPFTTIGLQSGDLRGPTLERGVSVGTGAKVIGNIRIGANSRIGANAVVVDDVAPATTVVGIPARPLDSADRRSA